MKRFVIHSLIFLTLTVIAVGCRRGRGTPQPPVSVKREGDALQGVNEARLLLNSSPKERKLEYYLEDLEALIDRLKAQAKANGENYDTLLKKQLNTDLAVMDTLESDPGPDKMPSDPVVLARLAEVRRSVPPPKDGGNKEEKLSSLVSPLKDARAKERKQREFAAILPLVVKFFKETPDFNRRSQDNLMQFLRRGDYTVKHYLVDKKDVKLVEDVTPLRDFVAQKKVVTSYEVDMAIPTQVVAHSTESDEGGQPAILVNGNIIAMKSDALKLVFESQEMRMLSINYLNYFKSVVKDNSKFAKRSADRLKKYLKANAQPSLAKMVEDNTLHVIDPLKVTEPRIVDPDPRDPAFGTLVNLANKTLVGYRAKTREITFKSPDGSQNKTNGYDVVWFNQRLDFMLPLNLKLYAPDLVLKLDQ